MADSTESETEQAQKPQRARAQRVPPEPELLAPPDPAFPPPTTPEEFQALLERAWDLDEVPKQRRNGVVLAGKPLDLWALWNRVQEWGGFEKVRGRAHARGVRPCAPLDRGWAFCAGFPSSARTSRLPRPA
jgi:hypothetical protein